MTAQNLQDGISHREGEHAGVDRPNAAEGGLGSLLGDCHHVHQVNVAD